MSFRMSCRGLLCLIALQITATDSACAANFAAMHTLSPANDANVRSLAWVPAASNSGTDLLIAGGEDQKLRVWTLSGTSPSITGTLVNTLGSIHGTIWALQWIGTHNVLASGSGDGVIRLWPLSVLTATHTCHTEANGNGNAVCCDGDGLGCAGAHLVSWRNAGMTKPGQVQSLLWISSDSILASAWSDGVIRLWDWTGGTPALTYRNSLPITGRAYSLGYSASVSQIVVASPDWPLLELWDKDGSSAASTLTLDLGAGGFGSCPTAHCDGIGAVALKSDGTKIATGSGDTALKYWDPSDGSLTHTVDGHASGVTALVWLDSESKLVSGASDGSLHQWDTTDTSGTAAVNTISAAHGAQISSLIWLDTLEVVASAGYDNEVKLWKCA